MSGVCLLKEGKMGGVASVAGLSRVVYRVVSSPFRAPFPSSAVHLSGAVENQSSFWALSCLGSQRLLPDLISHFGVAFSCLGRRTAEYNGLLSLVLCSAELGCLSI
jgi:hypothetical protein